MEPKMIITKNNKKPARRSVDLTKTDKRYEYPFDVNALTNAYISNPYHNQCIDLKTQNIVGEGLHDKTMERLEELTPKNSAFQTLYDTIKDVLIYGNAYWEIVKVGAADYQIFHVPAQTMKLAKDGFVQAIGEHKVEFTADQIYHFKYSTPLSTIYGAPDYLPILPSIELFKKIIAYNDNFFANNAIPDMAMVVKGGEVAPTALYNVRSFFRDKFQGVENAHKLLYLPIREGMEVEFKKLQSDQKDASFMELLKQTITDIIACHGIPPRLISIMNQGQLGGGSEVFGQMEVFYKSNIKPKQRIIAGLLLELNKKYHLFNDDADFDFIPIQFTEQNNNTLEDFMKRN